MICDSFENFVAVSGLPEADAKKIVDFCVAALKKAPEIGKYTLTDDGIYAMAQQYNPHANLPEKLEYHRDYADLQMIYKGAESILVAPIAGTTECVAYNTEKDIGFNRMPEVFSDIAMQPGLFLLLFPQDGHQPKVGDVAVEVGKIVVKIPMKLFR